MANKVIISPKFTLKARDFIKGLIVSVITSVLVVAQATIDNGDLKFDYELLTRVAISSAIAYLLKNFFSPASVTTIYDSNDKATKVANQLTNEKNS